MLPYSQPIVETLSIIELIGTGYTNGWFTNCPARYRAFKGARNTKKSYVIGGLEVLFKILSNPLRNVLMVRKTFASHRNSTFSTLKSLINQPDPYNHPDVTFAPYFKIKENDMTITYIPTGQEIVFAGFDNPQKLTSIRATVGFFTDAYFEEAFEIDDYDDFRKLDGSIRGKLPKGLNFQITFLFNAWNGEHWLNERFFKGRLDDDYKFLSTHRYQDYYDPDYIGDFGKGLYLHTSTYKINEFRDKEVYDLAMENLRLHAPEIYKVEALGMWGNATETTYPEFNVALVKPPFEINTARYSKIAIGIDFGISDGEGRIQRNELARYKSATTMQLVGISEDFNKLIAIDEYFWSNEGKETKKTGPQIQTEMIEKIIEWKDRYMTSNPTMFTSAVDVYVDCADSGGFRQGLALIARSKNLYGIRFLPSYKITIQSRVDFSRILMGFGDCLFSENCQNLIREIKNSRKGDKGKCRDDIDDHAINAWEYGWATIIGLVKRYKNFKQR